jgi:hypothetical protein
MKSAKYFEEKIVTRLQHELPLVAHAKPPLLSTLRRRIQGPNISPPLTVINVFTAGEGHELMCVFAVNSPLLLGETFVAPIDHISFGRRHPISREIAKVSNAERRRPPPAE